MDEVFELSTIFDGWGTEIVGILISLIVGAFVYSKYKNGKIKQKQKGGDKSEQEQIVKDSKNKDVSQSQKAGDNSKQTQIA